MTRKQELREFIKQGAPVREKIRRKPKIYGPDRKSEERNKLKESFSSEGV